jgi:hypothetical protein
MGGLVSLYVLQCVAQCFEVTHCPPATDSCSMTPCRPLVLLLLMLLLSAVLVCSCEQVFGAAACLSTHWVPGRGVPVAWLAQGNIPDPATHRWAYLPTSSSMQAL